MNTDARLLPGDCLEWLRRFPADSVDAVVTDGPYGLKFMGKRWDYSVPGVEIWAEVFRVLKPGGHLLSFAGTRTHHRMAVNIEDAGFDIRDMIAWAYGSGFPKSHNISKAIDKAAGAKRRVVGRGRWAGKEGTPGDTKGWGLRNEKPRVATTGATPDAARFDGWGTALKPAFEPITVARKPFKGTVAANVLKHGTAGINIDACRVSFQAGEKDTTARHNSSSSYMTGDIGSIQPIQPSYVTGSTKGRWPANLIHDGAPETVAPFGKAARFFYCAKASRGDRDEGLQGLEPKNNMRVNAPRENEESKNATEYRNNHPTVKPTALMRYLVRLVTPPGGVVLDPFMGSGSTGKAAALEGFDFIGIERDADYFRIAFARVRAALATQGPVMEMVSLKAALDVGGARDVA